jgi:hypothetical protein
MARRASGPPVQNHCRRTAALAEARARELGAALGVLVFLGASASPATALEALPVDLAEAVEKAGVIFGGLVTQKVVAWNEQNTIPLTTVTVSVVEPLKGTSSSEDVDLVFAGGTIEGQPHPGR